MNTTRDEATAGSELLDSCLSKDQQIIKLTVQLDERNEWVWEDRIITFICGLIVGLGVKAGWLLWL